MCFQGKRGFPREVFPSILKNGRRLTSSNFSLIVSYEAEGYAVVLPKKVTHLSTERHRIKRRIFTALRTLGVPLPPSLIIFPRASVSAMQYQDVKKDLTALLSKNLI